MNNKRHTDYQEFLNERLQNKELAANYLNEALKDEDQRVPLLALNNIWQAVIEQDPETGLYIGRIPSVPGAQTCAKSLDELQIKLKEVLKLCIEKLNVAELNK